MVVSVIMNQDSRPVCSEMWPGDTADVTTLIPVIDRLRQRFAIGRVCVVADRGMISAQTIASLEERGLEYILGVRERSSKEVQEVVLNPRACRLSSQRRDTAINSRSGCLRLPPFERRSVDPDAVEDHGNLPGDGDLCFLHSDALGQLHSPDCASGSLSVGSAWWPIAA